jgi:hypothetical protein
MTLWLPLAIRRCFHSHDTHTRLGAGVVIAAHDLAGAAAADAFVALAAIDPGEGACFRI